MKVLPNVTPTPEQLTILRKDPRSLLIVRGAAGSGKTTTALLRLKFIVDFWQRQFAREGRDLKVLVLTYNRTLAGYVEALANQQIKIHPHVTMEVSTFDKWASGLLGNPALADNAERRDKIINLGAGLGLDDKFLINEVDYVTGRFLLADLSSYLTATREGRGASPQMPRKLRERLLDEVIEPLSKWKATKNVVDWNDMAVMLASRPMASYNVVVVDETQDFHANRLRAILSQVAEQSTLTFVLDAAQRIYPHSFKGCII